MAGKRLSVSLTLNDKQFQSGLRKATRSMTKFGKSMQRTGKTLSTSLTLPVLAFSAASVKAFDEQIKAETKLRTALGEDEKAFARLKKQAQELQKLTLFGDEATIEAAAFLAQLGLNENAITKLLPLIQDFATAQNMQLGDAAKLVAKSVGSSTNALSRYGITIEGTVGETERLDSAVNALSTAFGGTASAIATQGLGPFQQLKNELGDVSEEFGKLILENIEPLKTALQGLASNLRSLSTEQKQTIIKVAGITAVVGPLLIVLGKLVTVIASVGKALIFLAANPMILFATSIATLVGLLGFAILDMGGFIKTALNLGKIGRLTAKAIIMFAEATGLMSKPEALAAIATIDGMSKEQEKLADSMEGTTHNIEEQQKAVDKLVQSMGKMPTPSTGGGMQSTGILRFEPIAAGPVPLSEDALDTTPLESYSAGLTDLQIKMQDTANTFERAFHSMAVSAEASGQQMVSAAANAARQIIKTYIAETVAAHLKGIFATVPFPLNLALASAAGSVVGSLFNKVIPPFAEGGMVSGATLAMVGEGPGTSAVNPEVIAPLDKLQGMIGNAGGGQVEVFGRLSGSDILISSDRARGNRNRTRGY
jgi:hypothetical protein